MKQFISIIVLFTFLAFGQIMQKDFPFVLNLAVIILIFLILISWEYSIINKRFEADLKFRIQKKKLFKSPAPFIFVWTTFIFFTQNHSNLLVVTLLLMAFTLSELVMYFVYKRRKPFTVLIQDDQLILNNRFTQKRNLTELIQIQFDRVSKNLILDFKSKPEVSIKTTEYLNEDIQKLLAIMIDKSENNVFIPPNYKPHKKAVPNED